MDFYDIVGAAAYMGDGYEFGCINIGQHKRMPQIQIGCEGASTNGRVLNGCVTIVEAILHGIDWRFDIREKLSDEKFNKKEDINLTTFLELEEWHGQRIDRSDLWIVKSPISDPKPTRRRYADDALARFYVKKPQLIPLPATLGQHPCILNGVGMFHYT